MSDYLNGEYDKYIKDPYQNNLSKVDRAYKDTNIYNHYGKIDNTYAQSRVNQSDRSGFDVDLVMVPLIDDRMTDEEAMAFMREHKMPMPDRYKTLGESFSGEREAVEAVVKLVNINHEQAGDQAEKPRSADLYDSIRGGITVIRDKDGEPIGRLVLDRQKEKYLIYEKERGGDAPGSAASPTASARLRMLYEQINVPEDPDLEEPQMEI